MLLFELGKNRNDVPGRTRTRTHYYLLFCLRVGTLAVVALQGAR